MQIKIRKSILLFLLAVFLLSAIGITAFSLKRAANAAEVESSGFYNFNIVTDGEGEQSYSIAIRATVKSTVETLVIPESYNGLPVTEIANNGFMACVNLQKVYLPTTIKKIGNNAFMNCGKLERISLPRIESIGMNAFALCPNLDRTYIPNTVKTVGSNVFRNNAKTVFVQGSADEINTEWQSTWNSYFTGDIVYGIEPEDTVGYREILDANNGNVLGYEVIENQWISAPDLDLIIYNSYRPDDESEYLPVLNICSEAFTFSQTNSITFKNRHLEDASAPEYNHKINIRSNAFAAYWGNEVSFEVGVTFNHPEGLQDTYVSMFDFNDIIGDSNNNSIKVFEQSTIKSITLPTDLDIIPERMFCSCTYLENIKYFNQPYNGSNILFAVCKVGAEAFSGCVYLSNLNISSTVTQIGESAFYEWGDGIDAITLEPLGQVLNIDFYEGYLPEDWNENWFGGSWEKTEINYKAPTEVIIDLQDDEENKINIGVKPGLEMPAIDKPDRKGYIFKGIYSEKEGYGLQYYSDSMQIISIWQNGDPLTLYANWDIVNYNIVYPDEINSEDNPNAKTYTIKDTVNIVDIKSNGYKYTFIPDLIERGTIGDITLDFVKREVSYKINYELDDWKGNVNTNPDSYTVTQGIVFQNLVKEYYDFYWSPANIPVGSTGDITVKGHWEPTKFNIKYDLNDTDKNPATNNSGNPALITYFDKVQLKAPYRTGYVFTGWQLDGKIVNTLSEIGHNITLIALWHETDINAGSDSTYFITDKEVYLNFSKIISNCKYEIYVSSTADFLSISSSYRNAKIDLNIIIDDRNKDFTLKIVGLNITAHSGRNAVVMKSDKMLNLFCENTIITGCDHLIIGVGNGSYTASNGSSAIYCKHLTIHSSVTLKGGSVSNPSFMGGVAVALAEGGTLTIKSNNVTIVGGNASLTLEGQGGYGYPVYANNKKYTINDYSNYVNVTLKNGEGKKFSRTPTLGY